MSNLEKYMAIKPSSDDAAEIKDVLQKSDKFISNIIVSVDEVEETSNKIDELVSLASQIKEKKVSRFFGNKDVIESLQSVADFQADIMNELWGYQQKMFDQFKNLADNSNNLIMLGIANAAVTRALIEQLRNKTKLSLSEEARNQLFNVIRDLERQADAQDRISRLREKVDSLGLTFTQELNNEATIRSNENTLLSNSIQQSSSVIRREIEELRSLIKTETNQLKLNIASNLERYAERLQLLSAKIKEVDDTSKTMNKEVSLLLNEINEEKSQTIANLKDDIMVLQSKTKKILWFAVAAVVIGILSIVMQFIL